MEQIEESRTVQGSESLFVYLNRKLMHSMGMEKGSKVSVEYNLLDEEIIIKTQKSGIKGAG